MFCFHGFGRNANDFKTFEQSLSKEYTMYSFNLFSHGNSEYPVEKIHKNQLTKSEFKQLFQKFIITKQISTFSLIGYSLGGKVALCLLELFPNQVDSLWLLAPDGIKLNFWYRFVTKTQIGSITYDLMLKNHSSFKTLVELLFTLKLLNKKVKKFTLNNMSTIEKRILVRNVWLIFKNLNPNLKEITAVIVQRSIPVYQFYGEYDKVIPHKIGNRFAKSIRQKHNLTILKKGHNLISKDLNALFEKIMK